MDTNDIGVFLKKLRLKFGYTQLELGKKLNVSDKAISRWESGTGLPEISNLVTIADLFGISVDDILHCNESVLDRPVEAKERPDDIEGNKSDADASAVSETPRTTTASATSAAKEVKPSFSGKFSAILFAVYLAVGSHLAIFIPTAYGSPHIMPTDAAVLIIATALVLLSATATALTPILPRKISFIIKISLCAASVTVALSLVTVFATVYGDKSINVNYNYADNVMNGAFAATCAAVVFILTVVRLLYLISEYVNIEKIGKVLRFVCIGVASAALITGIICMALTASPAQLFDLIFKGTVSFNNESCLFFSIYLVLAGIAAVAFTVKEAGVKRMDIVATVFLFLLALVALIASFHFCELTESPVYIDSPAREFVYALTLFAPAVCSLGHIFYGKRNERVAVCTTAAVAFVLLIPCFCYTLNVFALDEYLKAHGYATAVFLRIAVLIAAATGYVMQVISSLKKAVRPI